VLWRRYRRPLAGVTERTLAMNPGVAELGPFIPRGRTLTIPYVAPPGQTRRKVIKLWD
jgi:phage tail protein X